MQTVFCLISTRNLKISFFSTPKSYDKLLLIFLLNIAVVSANLQDMEIIGFGRLQWKELRIWEQFVLGFLQFCEMPGCGGALFQVQKGVYATFSTVILIEVEDRDYHPDHSRQTVGF